MAKIMETENRSFLANRQPKSFRDLKSTDSEHLRDMHFDVAHAVEHLKNSEHKDHPTVKYALTVLSNALKFRKGDGHG